MKLSFTLEESQLLITAIECQMTKLAQLIQETKDSNVIHDQRIMDNTANLNIEYQAYERILSDFIYYVANYSKNYCDTCPNRQTTLQN
jgi:hypothetical protein